MVFFENAVENPEHSLSFIKGTDVKGKPIRLQLACEALGNVTNSEFGHSVLCNFVEPKYANLLSEIEGNAEACLPNGIEFKPFLQDTKFFLKLKTKDEKYVAKTDPPFNPLTPEKSPISMNSLIEIEAAPGVWVNWETKTSGLFLQIAKITVDGGSRKKRRT